MREVPMASLAAPVYKSGFFQVGNQLSHFARHFSIKIVSLLFGGVKHNGNVRRGFDSRFEFNGAMGFFHGGAELFKFVVRVAAMDGFGFVAGELPQSLPLRLQRTCPLKNIEEC